MVLVTAAMASELQGFQASDAPSGLCVSPVGTGSSCSSTFQSLLQRHHPEAVIHIGICGSVSAELPMGSAFLPGWTAREESPGQRIYFDDELAAQYDRVLLQAVRGSRLCRGGGLLTCSNFVAQKRKEQIRSASRYAGVLGVDMECAVLAELCRKAQIPFITAKAVSDDLVQPGPKGLSRFIRRWSAIFAEASYRYLGTM